MEAAHLRLNIIFGLTDKASAYNAVDIRQMALLPIHTVMRIACRGDVIGKRTTRRDDASAASDEIHLVLGLMQQQQQQQNTAF